MVATVCPPQAKQLFASLLWGAEETLVPWNTQDSSLAVGVEQDISPAQESLKQVRTPYNPVYKATFQCSQLAPVLKIPKTLTSLGMGNLGTH
jgi:hypothetical protein